MEAGTPRRHVFSGKYRNVELSGSWEKRIQSTQECTPIEWDEYWSDSTTFTKSGILEKLEDGSRETRRLPRLALKHEVGQILGGVTPIESGGSPEPARTVSRQSGDPSLNVTIWAEVGSRQMRLQMTMRSEKTAVRDGDDVREYGSAR